MTYEKYPLNISDFAGKAEKALALAEKMNGAFTPVGEEPIKLPKKQREYLKIAIMAACCDSHYNGFANGSHIKNYNKH